MCKLKQLASGKPRNPFHFISMTLSAQIEVHTVGRVMQGWPHKCYSVLGPIAQTNVWSEANKEHSEGSEMCATGGMAKGTIDA